MPSPELLLSAREEAFSLTAIAESKLFSSSPITFGFSSGT
jgi:hypothetical protein